LFSAEVTGLIFTKLLHDVEALVALLTCVQGDIAFRFGTPKQRVKAGNFAIGKNPQN